MKIQKLQFALTSLHNLQKGLQKLNNDNNNNNNNNNNNKKTSKSDNKSKQKNTNVDRNSPCITSS